MLVSYSAWLMLRHVGSPFCVFFTASTPKWRQLRTRFARAAAGFLLAALCEASSTSCAAHPGERWLFRVLGVSSRLAAAIYLRGVASYMLQDLPEKGLHNLKLKPGTPIYRICFSKWKR